MATQAQIDANRKNAAQSTGPTTPLGKSVSRTNALKHGLAGAGEVIHPDEAAEVEARAVAFARHLRPVGEMARGLVRRAAVLAVRVDRCAEQEIGAVSIRGRQAEGEYADQLDEKIESVFRVITENPRPGLRRLLQGEAGVSRLIAAWADLKFDLDNGLWSLDHAGRLANLLGFRADECHAASYLELSEALMGVDNPERPGRSRTIRPESRCGWARAELNELIKAVVGALEETLDEIDPDRAARERTDFITLARLTPTPEMLRLRKYEAAAERMMYRALKEARLADDAALADEPAANPSAPSPAPSTTSEPLGSFPPGALVPPPPFELDPDADTTPLNGAERREVNEFLALFGEDYAHLIREVGQPG